MSNATMRLHIKTISDFSDVQSNVQNIQQYLNKLKLPDTIKGNFAGIFGNLEKEMAKYQKTLDSGFKTKGDITGFEKSGERISALLGRLQGEMGKLSPEILQKAFAGVDISGLKEAEQKVINLQQQLNNLISKTDLSKLPKEFASIGAAVDGTLAKMGKSKDLTAFKEAFQTGDIEKMTLAFDKLTANANKFTNETSKANYTQNLGQLKIILDALKGNPALIELTQQLNGAKTELTQLQNNNLDNLVNGFKQATTGVQTMNTQFRQSHSELVKTKTAAQGLGSELDMMKSRVQYFFGLTNSVMLFRRALNQAFTTVKELDAVMTEMAVVTDLGVGDYWKKLPEFSENARELGVTIKDAYESTTLYLQQGLAMAKAQEVANETLKMARIAGMEASEATDMMTAALRGFNMEINETSAQRINDVYSELAAISASNTQEIATAMTKTASIASSANMEFETTSALLAQIIETTREAPETAGTALKTVIARFQELKKAPSEIGEVDGEIVDANKIEGALRTIGVSLRDANGQFRALDDVFLEISAKWDTLDTNTQRYIATIAAGSRQQSRFIAMMSDYERTMELVNAANNSGGASQEQYEKTLESLQTKLNRLSVAWQTFLMGIADNSTIKFAIDALSKVLETINKLLSAVSGEGGLIKSILSLGLVFGGLSIAKGVFNKLFASMGAAIAAGSLQVGATAGTQMGTGLYNALNASLLKTQARLKAFSLKSLLITPKVDFKGFAKSFNQIPVIQKNAAVSANYYSSQLARQQAVINNTAASEIARAQATKEAEKIQIAMKNSEAASAERLKAAYLSLGLTEAQYDAIKTAGIPTDQMAIIMSNEQAKAHFLEALSKEGATKESIELAAAESVLIARQKMGLLTKLKNYAALLFGNKATRLAAMQQLGLATATEAKALADGTATASQMGLNAAIYACPLGWILAAIAAVVAIFVILAKVIETDAEKMERLNEEAEASAAAAEEAKNAYDELLSAFDEYDTAQEALDGLVRGTEEWREALIEANNEVIELLKLYPELAKYIQRGKHGELEISAEGRKEFLENQEAGVVRAQQAAVGAEMYAQAHEWDMTQSEFDGLFYDPYSTDESMAETHTRDAMLEMYKTNPADLFKIEDEDFTGEELYELFKIDPEKAQKIWEAEGLQDSWGQSLESLINDSGMNAEWFNDNIEGMTLYSDALYDIAQQSLYSADYLYGLKDSIAEYTSEQMAVEAKMQGHAASVLALGASDALVASDYSGQIQDLFVGQIDYENFDEEVEAAAAGYNSKDYSEEELTEMYLEKTGLTELPDDIKEGGKKALADALAEIDVLSGTTEDMNKFYEDFSKLDPKQKDNALKALQKDGKGFTREMMTAYSKYYTVGEDGKAVIDDQEGLLAHFESETGLEAEDIAKKMGFVDENGNPIMEDFAQYLADNSAKTEEAFARAKARLTATNIDVSSIEESGISSSALAGLSDHIYQALLSGGPQAAQEISTKLGGIMENLSPEQAEKFAGALNAIDWTDQESIRGFSDIVKELGIETGMSEAELAAFEEEMIDLNGATKEFSLDKVKEELKSLQDLADDIEGRDGDFTFSTEDKDLLIKTAGVSEDQFVLNGIDEWVYIGGTLEGLLSTIDSNTAAILAEMRGDIDAAVEKGQQWKALTEDDNWYGRDAEGNLAEEAGELNALEVVEGLINGGFTYRENGEWGNAGASRSFSRESIEELVTMSGANVTEDGTVRDLESFDTQGLIDLLARSYNEYYGVGGAVLANNEAKQTEIEEQTTQQQNMMRNAQEIAGEETSRQLQFNESNTRSAYQMMGLSGADVERAVESERQYITNHNEEVNKEQIETLKAQARLWGVNESAIQEFDKALAENENYLDENTKAILANAISNKKAEAQLKKTSSKIGDIMGKYEDYNDFLDSDIQDIGTALGLDNMEVGGENFKFIQDNLQLIDKAMNGDIASMNALQAKLAEGAGFKITGDGDFSAVNEDFDIANQNAQDFIKNMIAAGMFEVETVEIEEGASYIQPFDDNGDGIFDRFEEVGPVTTKQTVQLVKPVDAPNIQNATGNYSGTSNGSINGGGGGGSGPAENEHDKYYNLMQDINAELREREKIERRYNKLLEDRKSSGRELYEASQEELANLERQRKMQEEMLRLRKEERQGIIDENSSLSAYVKYNSEDNTIEIDWEKIDALAKDDPDKYEEVSEYISELEDIQGKIEEAEDALYDIEDSVDEIKRRGEDDYIDLESRILDALVEEQNKIIESQEEINESINNAASELVDAIQSSIDKLRQDRENEDTEQSLAEKERRLAYLRQDTSGANAMEIRKLEEEIANDRESYGDTLVDQALQDLQEQNDEAAEQRERQISLMQEQLEWGQENGYYAAAAHQILEDTLKNGGLFDVNSRFYQLLYSSEGWESKSHSERLKEMQNLHQTLKAAYEYMKRQNADDGDWPTIPTNYADYDYMDAIKKIEEDFKAGNLDYDEAFALIQQYEAMRDNKINTFTDETRTQTYGQKYGVTATNGALAKGFQERHDKGKNYTVEQPKEEPKIEEKPEEKPPEKQYTEYALKDSDTLWDLAKKQLGSGTRWVEILNASTKKPFSDYEARRLRVGQKVLIPKFKTGGLADFTGPAWLDGTKSRPEMVLNAQDTENFLVLKDILSSLLHLPTVENTSGDNYFDISIQVDEISDDYDVDQMVERVKQKIYEDSMYRNNNSINLLR